MKFPTSIIMVLLFLSPILLGNGAADVTMSTDMSEGIMEPALLQTGWLSGWAYRRSHSIYGSTGAGSAYQISITIHYEDGYDSGAEVYLDGLCKSDFGDIRFTDDDGVTQLAYWMEELHVSDNATFWVEVQDSLDVDVTIWMYYGNTLATNNSDGFSTFIFFDDFESDTLGADPDPERWWLEAAQDPDDYVRILQDPEDSSNQVLCAAETGDTIANVAWTNNWTSAGPVAIGQKFRYDLDYKGYLGIKNETNNWIVIDQLDYVGENNHNWFIDQNYYDYSPPIYTATDEWFSWEYRCSPDGMTLLDRDTGQIHVGGFVYTEYSDPHFASARYGLRHGANTWWTDDMYVRKFVSSEPIHGDWGNSDGEEWLTDWEFRKAHTIEGFQGAGLDYQVMIVAHFGAGVDSGNQVYCDGYSQSNFSDIRFTDDDGFTPLDHWCEVNFESENATYWVEVRDTLDYDQTIYVYYGNPDANGVSNGEETFIFFDDFGDESIDTSKWDAYGPWTESGSVASFSIVGTGGTSVLPDLMSDNAWDMRNKSIASRWRVNALTVNREWGVSCANTVGDDHTRLAYFLALNTSGNDNVRSYYDANDASGYDYYNLIIGQYPPSVFMKTEFVSTPNNVTKNSWILDGNVLDTYSGNTFDSTPQRIFLGFYVHGYTNTLVSGNLEMEFDWVYLRNQIGLDPAHGIWETMESALSIESPTGLTYEAGTTSHSVVWSVFSFYPHWYSIYFEGVLQENGTWDGTDFETQVGGLDLGTYNLTLQIINTFGYSLSYLATLRVVDTTYPILSQPDDIVYTEGASGNTIEWTMTDLFPATYEVGVDNTTFLSGDWNSTGESVILPVDGLSTGIYNYSVTATDGSGNSATDFVAVIVQPNYTIVILLAGGVVVIIMIGAIACRFKKS